MAYVQRVVLTRRIEDARTDSKQEHLFDLIKRLPGIQAPEFQVASVECWRLRVDKETGEEGRVYDEE